MVEILFQNQAEADYANRIIMLPFDRTFNPDDYTELFTAEELRSLRIILENNKFAENVTDDIVVEEIDTATDKMAIYDLPTGKVAVAFLPEKADALAFQNVGGRIARRMSSVEAIVCYIKNNKSYACGEDEAAYNVALGFELGNYTFDKYFTTKKAYEYSQIEKLTIIAKNADQKNYAEYAALANSVRYARDMINEPANYLIPAVFAEDIKRLEYLGLEVEIFNQEQLKEMGFNLLLAVAQGSDNPPYVAVMSWRGNEAKDGYDAGFVGKGVCFDSGGLSIKTGDYMLGMHHDMAGAAAVVATLKAAALQKLKANVIGIVGLVENMPSGHATRVNDIVPSLSGKTVEILNTDAEGRLVLADCLWYLADNYAPEVVIDIATLTGAVARVFGRTYAGLMGNNAELKNILKNAGDLSGERLWELPLDKAYDRMIDSDVADMKNIGGVIAGGMTAGCFLQRFVKKGTNWAHVDIAGVDEQEKPFPTYPKGATGFGVLLFNKFLHELIKNKK